MTWNDELESMLTEIRETVIQNETLSSGVSDLINLLELKIKHLKRQEQIHRLALNYAAQSALQILDSEHYLVKGLSEGWLKYCDNLNK